jgi:hypothetical protein
MYRICFNVLSSGFSSLLMLHGRVPLWRLHPPWAVSQIGMNVPVGAFPILVSLRQTANCRLFARNDDEIPDERRSFAVNLSRDDCREKKEESSSKMRSKRRPKVNAATWVLSLIILVCSLATFLTHLNARITAF